MLGPEKFRVLKNFGSLKILVWKILGPEKWCPEKCWVRKMLGPEKCWVLKNVGSRKMLGPEKCWVLKNVGSWKMSSQQNFGFRKILGPQTILDHEKILVLKIAQSYAAMQKSCAQSG